MNKQQRHAWVVNHHAVIPSKDGSAARHLHLARQLKKHGWETSLIVASTRHPSGEQTLNGLFRTRSTLEDGVPVLAIRSKSYTAGMYARVIGMVSFALNLSLPRATASLERPDVVIGSTVHPLAAWAGSILAKRNKVPFVFEIRDVWPDALVELGMFSENSVIARAVRALMISIAKQAALVVAPLPHVDRWLQEQGLGDKPFVWVSNGTEVTSETPPVPVPDREHFTFMYLGAHGNANVLDTVIDAFDEACQRRPDLNLRLRLVGQGPKKEELIAYAATLRSTANISFEDRIPASEVKARAAEADAMISALAGLPMYRYGISLNKLFTYLDSGRPTVWASSAPNNPIREANAGICVESDDREALTKAIIDMATTPVEERTEMARRGWQYVKENYSFEVLGRCLADSLDRVVEVGG